MTSRWKSKSSKPSGNSSKEVDNSSKAFQLNKNRFVSISEFRGQVRVDIREFYFDDNGDRRPGKKGISLSMDEWNKLKSHLPKIDKAIKGIDDSASDDSDHKHKKKKSSESDSEEEAKSSKKAKLTKVDTDSDEESDEPKKKSKKSKNLSSDSESV